jgi:hypothetical protein
MYHHFDIQIQACTNQCEELGVGWM